MKIALKVIFWVGTAVVLAWIAESIGGPGTGGTVLLVIGVMLGVYYGVEISSNYSARVEQYRQDLISGRKHHEGKPTTTVSDDSSGAPNEDQEDDRTQP